MGTARCNSSPAAECSTPRPATTCPTSSSTPAWCRPAEPQVQRFDSFVYFSPSVRPEFLVSAVSCPVMPLTHVGVRDASRWRTARRIRRTVLLLGLLGITNGAGLATAGLALAANG